ncbi:carbon storage regulator [Rubripirellula reticaptiva]|uniref:Translational regulator CsrA n=1 Tax=Rubripirellula reticaptiva TaxID=2528013 RepID=A0A5C6F9C4_9BACT|nr:carbon storage regulator [Rubripirellula reticaptiva]TWU57978.1 carbon storage regulator [Rubripirellula reticaptiva]
MLVLSRKIGESIEIPALGVVVRILDLKTSRTEIGIEAPRELAIVRGEIADRRSDADMSRSAGSSHRMTEEIQVGEIEAQIAALAKLASPTNRAIAGQLAADLQNRIAQLKSSQPLRAIPVDDRVAIRPEVLDELRRKQAVRNKDAICVRQASVGYAIDCATAVSA